MVDKVDGTVGSDVQPSIAKLSWTELVYIIAAEPPPIPTPIGVYSGYSKVPRKLKFGM